GGAHAHPRRQGHERQALRPAALAAPPACGEPRDAPPERARGHADHDQGVAAAHRHGALLPAAEELTAPGLRRPGGDMSVELIRELYDYHHWANRRLFGIAADLGDGVTMRDMGKHWSFPTIKGMFAHLYGADRIWLSRWTGAPPARMEGDADFISLGEHRSTWDVLYGRH